MIQVYMHGGNCCGVKHMINFGGDPNIPLQALAAVTDYDKYSFSPGPSGNGANDCGVADSTGSRKLRGFYNQEAPREMAYERFNRVLDFVLLHRPSHMIEILLTDTQNKWFPVIEARGFRHVGRVKNCNSSSHINMFLLCVGEAAFTARPEAPEFVAKPLPEPPARQCSCGDPNCTLG